MKVQVEPWKQGGAVGIQVEQWSQFGEWVLVLYTGAVGTFPNYTTIYDPINIGTSDRFRYRWETMVDQWTDWFTAVPIFEPTAEQTERFAQAVIQKATRILMLSKAPLGSWGEISEFGVASVRADYEIEELLYGLRFRNWDVDLTALVTTAMVIRQGLQTDPVDFPADRLPDVQRAVDAAVSWVAGYILEGANIG